MKIGFWYPRSIENWQPSAPDRVGIGCSETALVQIARRLAARGHEVVVYSSCEPCDDQGVAWKNCGLPIADCGLKSEIKNQQSEMPHDAADVWISHRCADTPRLFPGGRHYLWAQDVDAVGMTKANREQFTAVLVMCKAQRRYIEAKHRVPTIMTSNAARLDLLVGSAGFSPSPNEERPEGRTPNAERPEGRTPNAERPEGRTPNVERNPFRMMFASSPDRGLVNLLRILPKIREFVPQAELHAFYGLNNMEKLEQTHGFAAYRPLKAEIEWAQEHLEGFHYHGRVGQPELYREWLSSGLWVHPSDFTETSCETSMAAMCCGAIPVTRPFWAIADHVRFGALVTGPVAEPLILQEYVAWTVMLMNQPELAEDIRAKMVPWARSVFSWDRVADQWEEDILADPKPLPRRGPIADWSGPSLRDGNLEANPPRRGGPHEEAAPTAAPIILERKTIGTVAFCQKDWLVTPRSSAKCARDLAAYTSRIMGPAQDVFWLEEAGTDHATVRNNIVEKFEGDWVLQLDCDHTYDPDLLARMLRPSLAVNFLDPDCGIDVLTGVYYHRKPPHIPQLYLWHAEQGSYMPLAHWPMDKLWTAEGLAAGGGCLLVRRKVFEQLGPEPFARIPPGEDVRLMLSEDLSFFYRCRLAGIQVWVAPHILAGHIIEKIVGPADFVCSSPTVEVPAQGLEVK